jgi:hypothetical protein
MIEGRQLIQSAPFLFMRDGCCQLLSDPRVYAAKIIYQLFNPSTKRLIRVTPSTSCSIEVAYEIRK